MHPASTFRHHWQENSFLNLPLSVLSEAGLSEIDQISEKERNNLRGKCRASLALQPAALKQKCKVILKFFGLLFPGMSLVLDYMLQCLRVKIVHCCFYCYILKISTFLSNFYR